MSSFRSTEQKKILNESKLRVKEQQQITNFHIYQQSINNNKKQDCTDFYLVEWFFEGCRGLQGSGGLSLQED